MRSLVVASGLLAACATPPEGGTIADAGVAADGSGTDGSGTDGSGNGDGGPIGDAEQRYIAATETLTQNIDTADCARLTTLLADYDSYYPAMTNEGYRDLASTRFRPVLDFMSRKLCNPFEIAGDVASYQADAVADSPAGEYLSGTPLLQAIVDESADLDGLLATANAERSTQGLDPIIVADYPNSIVGGPTSTIVFFPGWPGRPDLDQWVQVQRTIGQMFFVTLEPRADGHYNSYAHGRTLVTQSGMTTVASSVENGTCLQCHYSGRPIHMRALTDSVQAARVATLVDYLRAYPAATNHPDYNPFPTSPGIGTGGRLTLDEATAYAGRTLTTDELATLNQNTSCDTCHNDTYQNALRPPFGQTIDILMRNGIMPPGAGVVDATERAEAIRVMIAAYRVRLRRYFLGN